MDRKLHVERWLLALKAAERHRPVGLILISPELPAGLRTEALPFELADVPDVYGRNLIGWSTLPEKLQRDHRDLTIADVLRVQHMLGQKAHESGLERNSLLVNSRGLSSSRSPVRLPCKCSTFLWWFRSHGYRPSRLVDRMSGHLPAGR